jgi:hypothetical protein
MKKKRFTKEQIAMARRQTEAGTPVAEICRKLQVTRSVPRGNRSQLCLHGAASAPYHQMSFNISHTLLGSFRD